MRRRFAILFASLLSLLWAASALAHPLAPGLLVVSQEPGGFWQVEWKTPLRQNPASGLSPVLPPRCEPVSPVVERQEGTARVLRWRVDCGAGTLAGERIGVDGLDGSRAGVLVRLVLADDSSRSQMLNADNPDVSYPSTSADIIAAVNDALASQDKDTILALATSLDRDNNAGCPLGNGS